MTIDKPESSARTTEQPTPQEAPAKKHPREANAETAKPETEEDKIKREQATNPALMPIGDPAGAA